jgi:hypothetical protein
MYLVVRSFIDLHLVFLAKLIGHEIIAILKIAPSDLTHFDTVYNYYLAAEKMLSKRLCKRVKFAADTSSLFEFFKDNCLVVSNSATDANQFNYGSSIKFESIELVFMNLLLGTKHRLFDLLAHIYTTTDQQKIKRKFLCNTTPFFYALHQLFSKDVVPNISLFSYSEPHIAIISNEPVLNYANLSCFVSLNDMLNYEATEQILFDIILYCSDCCSIKHVDWIQLINECMDNPDKLFIFKRSNWYCHRSAPYTDQCIETICSKHVVAIEPMQSFE